ncbi:response regulator receiver modulated CheB methylesterase [Ferroglobus placidus DSM 10642]|uniref:Protein-glutamate methylesterase/protein-glutamine glutaminase n=1 Tax=Ferroglobus placidus (strain DSM 10642 / AEDII12DO) TaxID=589924 RepID=D3RXM2_FERPA|nr:chemotaxis response regulator protein-glutamate methylesterase [Ferroglobus placidus]ADC65235.1 response regulator receiver modulated CheB methylesterase [Ferroglobus placidus DSM 10642]
MKVLVVDDSALVRTAVSNLLVEEGFEVITAKNGKDAIEKTLKHNPDVILLDVNMPVMDGLTALKEIMNKKPTPVIMFSAYTKKGAEETITALKLGAVDFIPKPDSTLFDIADIKKEIIGKIKAISRASPNLIRLRNLKDISKGVIRAKWKEKEKDVAVLIGSSTGGPSALEMIIPRLPGDLPAPVFVVQHMPPNFTKQLAERLNSISEIKVKEAENNEKVRDGVVYIAPGGYHLGVRRALNVVRIKIIDGEPVNGVKPSVDVTAKYLAKVYGGDVIGVILTGMGEDGAVGLKEIRDLGGYVIACSEDTSVVFGMPKAAIEIGAASIVKPLHEIAEEIIKQLEVKLYGG